MAILNDLNIFLINFITDYKELGLILCSFLIMIEALLPFLPLSFFVTIVFLMYGKLIGFILSFTFSVLGSILAFLLFSKIHIKKKYKYIDKFSNINFFVLILLYAIPFNPTFIITMICSITKITFKKFVFALIIGKLFEIYFWGFVGCSIVSSLTNHQSIVKVIIIVLIIYVISFFIKKKYKF